MCGAINPERAITCQECGARLVPIERLPVEEAEISPAPREPVQEEEEIPPWLRELRESVKEAAALTLQEEIQAPPEEVPEWLVRLRASLPEEEEQPAVPPFTEKIEIEELPEWLREIGEKEPHPAEKPPVEIKKAPLETGELPEWLQSIPWSTTQPAAPPAVILPEAEKIAEAESPLTETEEAPTSAEAPPLAEVGRPPGEMTLKGMSTPAVLLPEEEEVTIPPLIGLPDWLRETGPEPELPIEAAAPKPPVTEQPELYRAEVPAWLEKLRPGELGGEGAPQSMELQGLLAGLQGVLPAEPIITAPKEAVPSAPPPVAIPPEAVKLFGDIATSGLPTEAPKPVTRPTWWSKKGWRLLVNLTLLLALLVPLLLNTHLAGQAPPNPENGSFYKTITDLPPGSLVVVAFEYDPSTAGEMDTLAETVLHHLIIQGARILAASLVPAGAAQAQQVLERVARDHEGYNYGSHYLNLGYLPGQEVALRTFVLNPLGVTGQDYVRGEALTADRFAVLGGPLNMSDIKLIIVFSAAYENLRWWLEQVGSQSSSPPIVAAVSAAIEPQVLPFFQSGQLAGVLAGLPGAATYELITNRQAKAVGGLDAQSWGSLALVFMILVGNGVYLITRNRRRG